MRTEASASCHVPFSSPAVQQHPCSCSHAAAVECKGNKKYSAGLESGLHDAGICVLLQSMTGYSHHSTDCQVLAGTVELILWVAGTDITCYAEIAL